MASDWRWTLLNYLGPGGYPGFRFGDWLQLLAENRFAVSPAWYLRAASQTASSLTISPRAWHENWRYGAEVEATKVEAPLFILGHWRSGTTFLHQLFGLDEQFAFPNLHQVSFPHTFLSTESMATVLTRFMLPDKRPFDDVRQRWEMPYEDEIATAMLTRRSPYLALFPRRMKHYDRYLTFDNVPEEEIEEWRAGLMLFLKKLTWKFRRPLVLKSPPHTCRIRILLEMFPEARFVHICRNPYDVFRSTMHLIDRGFQLTCFHWAEREVWIERTLRIYQQMYSRYFQERSLIPSGRLHEIRYEQLERDPLGEVAATYEALSMTRSVTAESNLDAYLGSVADYQKNEFPPIDPDLRSRIESEWEQCFNEWGYSSGDQ